MRPRSTASAMDSSMRSRVSITRSKGRIRFLRSRSRSSATFLPDRSRRVAGRVAAREGVRACLRAFCWRPRACPPLRAAALRDALERERLEALDVDRRDDDELLPDVDARLPPPERDDEALLDPLRSL